ncbi:PREDICTED: uncharacterized protein LOC106816332, partial [Priapulus caudatus]|uniref:Uncharacterized protein LOC106816332 n=1 Tax=Priapulus caudatus TaxID=37621 RepID=A0ABM1EW28_PRICU
MELEITCEGSADNSTTCNQLQCVGPCDWDVLTVRECSNKCNESAPCMESCMRLSDLRESFTDHQEPAKSRSSLLQTPPELVCRDTADSGDGGALSTIFIKWNVEHSKDGVASKHVVVFVVEIRSHSEWISFGKTLHFFIPIYKLRPSSEYQIRVTAVLPDGVAAEPQVSEWIKTLPVGALPQPPSNITFANMRVRGASVGVDVNWIPPPERTCYYNIYWYSSSSSGYGDGIVRMPYEFVYRIEHLDFGTNYTIVMHSTYHSQHESREATMWLLTTPCLEATNYDYKACVAGESVGSVSAVYTVVLPACAVTLIVIIVLLTIGVYRKLRILGRNVKVQLTDNVLYRCLNGTAAPNGVQSNDSVKFDKFEINFSSLVFEEVLGEGAFGKVVRARVVKQIEEMRHLPDFVAVKMLKDAAAVQDTQNLLDEIEMMKCLGKHANVISILACVTTAPTICLVVEYCENGDLHTYLRQQRENTKVMYSHLQGNQRE